MIYDQVIISYIVERREWFVGSCERERWAGNVCYITGIDGTIDRFRATGNNKNGGRLRPTPDQAGTVLCIKE